MMNSRDNGKLSSKHSIVLYGILSFSIMLYCIVLYIYVTINFVFKMMSSFFRKFVLIDRLSMNWLLQSVHNAGDSILILFSFHFHLDSFCEPSSELSTFRSRWLAFALRLQWIVSGLS